MVVLFGIVIFIIGVVLNGFALAVLWDWFVSDVFGVKNLSVPEALGIALLVGFLTHSYAEDKRDIADKLASIIARPIIVVLIGAIYQLFI